MISSGFSECDFNIECNDIHIWKVKISYDLFEKNINNGYCFINNEIKNYITEEEYYLCLKFYKTKDKIRSFISKFLLKKLISNYLNLSPNLIFFRYNEYSKPFIVNNINLLSLQFNISHAGEYIVFAFTKSSNIGIDIELYDKEIDKKSLVNAVFSEQEILQWENLSEDEKLYSFYHVWSCKEALLKGIGVGLSFSPNNITVNINKNDEPKIMNICNYSYNNNWKNWELGKFFIHNNYSAIYAVEFNVNNIYYFNFDWSDFVF